MERLIYLSGAITGVTHGDANNWREYARDFLLKKSDKRIKTLSPMRGKRYLDNGKPIEAFNNNLPKVLSTDGAIYTRDRNDVCRCSAMLVNFLGATRVSIGSVMEIAWADLLNKPMVMVAEPTNLHLHPILNRAVKIIVPTLNEGLEIIYEIVRDDTF
jgi:hypothetical protein